MKSLSLTQGSALKAIEDALYWNNRPANNIAERAQILANSAKLRTLRGYIGSRSVSIPRTYVFKTASQAEFRVSVHFNIAMNALRDFIEFVWLYAVEDLYEEIGGAKLRCAR